MRTKINRQETPSKSSNPFFAKTGSAGFFSPQTHTIQQGGEIAPELQSNVGDNHDLQSTRFAGDTVLEACMDGEQTLQFGSRGSAVRKMQRALVAAGFPLPVYGVDGIFEEETQGALQDFQRASSLPDTGVLDSRTISALDSLFYIDEPMHPSEETSYDVAPEIEPYALNLAPENDDTARTEVGVGERIRFYANTAGIWTATEGRIIGLNNGENMLWEAPPVAANSTVSLTTPGGAVAINMTVIAPSSLDMSYLRSEDIPVGTAGACMFAQITMHPLSVNFGRVQFCEVPGPATNVAGYFERFSAARLRHRTAGHYVAFDNNNSGVEDHAYEHALPDPYLDGTYQWEIPNNYKIDGEPDSQGRHFTDTVQRFRMFECGAVLITKSGTCVLRFISDTILPGN